MAGTKENPQYSAYIVAGDKKYNVTKALTGIRFSEQENQIAKSASIDMVNIKVGNYWLSSLLKVRSRAFVYADDGERSEEVWRGFIWARGYESATAGHSLSFKCYDNLIYFQESDDSLFFSSGKSTKDVLSTIFGDWGVKLSYAYESINHGKLALRGALSDIITADILDLVKDRTGKKYVVLSEKDTVHVKAVGSNTTIYDIKAGNNAIKTRSECTMAGMKTKVKILGKADNDDRRSIEAVVSGDTAQYGTLQATITRDSDTSLADAKKEAQNIVDEKGKPRWEYEVTAADIPWIRKGDKVNVSAGDMAGKFIVLGIERDISSKGKIMTLTMEAA